MNHLSGDQIIRLLFSESQEFVDELSLTAFEMARHPAHAHPPLIWSREGEAIANPYPAGSCGIRRLGAARGSSQLPRGRTRIAQRLALVRRLWQEAKRFVGAARLKMLQ